MGTKALPWYVRRVALPAADQPVRPASTVLALRPGGSGFEVLMVRRTRSAAFMGDAHVFPGGALEDCDHRPAAAAAVRWGGDPEELPWRAAALRELAEEAGVFLTEPAGARAPGRGSGLYAALSAAGAVLDADQLAYYSNWVTPRGLPRRFNARFYAALLPAGTPCSPDRHEVTEACWVEPAEALRRADAGQWRVEFPTRKHLEALAAHPNAPSVLAAAPGPGAVARMEPRLVVGDGGIRIILPGEPGYEEAGR
jgi:8-oxo-dGTP pyrophosphatase MutT (NUDIX family)